MAQDRATVGAGDLRTVDAHADRDPVELGQRRALDRGSEHEPLLLRVVGERQRELASEIAASLDDLEGRVNPGDGRGDILVAGAGREVAA
jgi:hypothetical protein